MEGKSGKIKVLHLVEALNIGGMERVVACLARNTDRENYDLEVWCSSRGGEAASELSRDGVKVRVLGINSCYGPGSVLKLAGLFREHRPDILHTHTYFANTLGRLAALIAGVPVVIVHVHSIYYGQYSRMNMLVERLLSIFTDKVICCSEAVKEFVLMGEKVDPSKLTVILNGVEPENFVRPLDRNSCRASLGLDERDKVVITVAALTKRKGHRYVLDALARIAGEHGNVKYLVVGDGPSRNMLAEQALRLGLKDNVQFTGNRGDVPDLLRISDIFVLPSTTVEGLPISAIEAMAAGLPVVATGIGGVPEVVVDGSTGILVTPEDPAAIGGAVRSLLSDRDLAGRMGHVGRKVFLEKFSFDVMMARVEGLYKDLVENERAFRKT